MPDVSEPDARQRPQRLAVLAVDTDSAQASRERLVREYGSCDEADADDMSKFPLGEISNKK